MIQANFLPQRYADELESDINGASFPWFFNRSTVYSDGETYSLKDYQFTHTFVRNGEVTSQGFDRIKPIIYFFEQQSGFTVKAIDRIKANLMVYQEFDDYELEKAIHIDCPQTRINDKFITLVYYVTNSDGETVLFDNDGNVEATCSPIKNTAFWFASNKKHRPTPPKENKKRIVINFVFEVE